MKPATWDSVGFSEQGDNSLEHVNEASRMANPKSADQKSDPYHCFAGFGDEASTLTRLGFLAPNLLLADPRARKTGICREWRRGEEAQAL